MKRVRPRELRVQTTIDLPIDVDDRLRRYCDREGLTIRAVLVAALNSYLDPVEAVPQRASA